MISKLLSWLQHLFRNPLVRGAVLLGNCLVLLAVAFSSYKYVKQGDLKILYLKILYLDGLSWLKGLSVYDPDVLLLEKRWRLLTFTGITSLVLCLFTQLVSGSPTLILNWFGGLESYLTVKEKGLNPCRT